MTEIAPQPPAAPFQADPLGDPGEARRWAKALAIVLGIHAVPVLVAAWWLGPVTSSPAREPAVLIDMAPPAAPPVPPSEQPPGPKQVKAETPEPKVVREVVKTPPIPNPVVSLPVPPPAPPREEAKEIAHETTAPPARPTPPAPRPSSAQPTWQGLVLGALDKVKRYPREAQSVRQQGVPWIRFTIDRQGKVLSSRLERSSGFRALDAEAVALPRRAQPLPKPPDDVEPGKTLIELVTPVEFYIR